MLIQFLFIGIACLALWFTWRRVSQNALRRSEGFLWTLVWLAIVIVVLRPEVANWFADVFGIGRGADLVVYGSIVVLFLLTFQAQIALERIERSLTELVSRQALRELEETRK